MKFIPDYKHAHERIRPGEYVAEIVTCVDHTSKVGTKCARWSLKLKGGNFDGRAVNLVTPLYGPGSASLRQLLQVLSPGYFEEAFDSDIHIGKRLWVRLLDDKINGDRSYLKVVPLRLYEEPTTKAPEEVEAKTEISSEVQS